MRFSSDRTGFPLVTVPSAGIEAHLLPVTKVQFERFIAEPNGFGDSWYEEVLRLNDRISYRNVTASSREGLFMTGILPSEAQSLAAWLGDGFDLPTVDEWRALYGAFAAEPASACCLPKRSETDVATFIVGQLLAQLEPRSLLDLSLMRGGIVEWVREGNSWAGLGVPRPSFHPNLFNPLTEVVTPIHLGQRVPYFGVRFVHRADSACSARTANLG